MCKFKDLKCNDLICDECPFYHSQWKQGLYCPSVKDRICLAGRRNDTLQQHLEKFDEAYPEYTGNLLEWYKVINKEVPARVMKIVNQRREEQENEKTKL